MPAPRPTELTRNPSAASLFEPTTGAPIVVGMSAPDAVTAPSVRHQPGVRAATACLRVVPVWQALGRHACKVVHIDITCDGSNGFEEMTISFADVSPRVLVVLVKRLVALPWVLDAWFYP